MSNFLLRSNICSILSSKIDWCEPNYVVLIYVAEFWNTISNLPFFVLPPLLIKLYEDYATRVPHSKHVNIVWISLLIIGVGSAYFHSTLSLLGQFVDEAGILWVCSACAAVWMLDQNLPTYFQLHRKQYQLVILILTFLSTLLGFLKPEMNHFFLFLFLIPSIVVLRQQYYKVSSPAFQKLNKLSFQIWALALSCWILDRLFCSFWVSISFPYLHAIWHVLVAFGGYLVCVCFSYCFAIEQASREHPILKFKTYFNIDWLGLWYVTFDNASV